MMPYQPKLTKLERRVMELLTAEGLAAEVHPGELGGLDRQAIAERLVATEERVDRAMRKLERLGFVSFHPAPEDGEPEPEDQSGPPREWTRLFRLLSTMRAEYPYATCTQAPHRDTHLIVGNLDMGLYVMILALGITPLRDGGFTVGPPESDDEAEARRRYAEVGIRSYATALALRGEIDRRIARRAEKEIRDLLAQGNALSRKHAGADDGDEAGPIPPFWGELGFTSFDAWLPWHREIKVNDDGT
jgi:hypothetical protein